MWLRFLIGSATNESDTRRTLASFRRRRIFTRRRRRRQSVSRAPTEAAQSPRAAHHTQPTRRPPSCPSSTTSPTISPVSDKRIPYNWYENKKKRDSKLQFFSPFCRFIFYPCDRLNVNHQPIKPRLNVNQAVYIQCTAFVKFFLWLFFCSLRQIQALSH